jgi:hypothetical protein
MSRIVGRVLLLWLAAGIGGCARGPAGGGGQLVSNRLIFDWIVQGFVRDQFYYFVAIDDDANANTGPIPVIGPPLGNGWGTGSFTLSVEYHAGQYRLLQHTRNPDGTISAGTVVPTGLINAIAPRQLGGDEFRFELDINQLIAQGFLRDARTLDVNFIITDQIIVNPNVNFKTFDGLGGLGQFGNVYVTIPFQVNGSFENGTTGASMEDIGDVENCFQIDGCPDLDIADWSIDVQRSQ